MKKKTNGEPKSKKKINLFDVLLATAIVGMLVALVIRGGYISELLLTDAHSVTYTVKLSAVDTEIASTFKEQDKVYPENSYISMGTVSLVTVSDASVTIRTASGSAVVGTLPGKKDVTIVIDTRANVKNTGVYTADGTELTSGSDLEIVINGVSYTVIVEKIAVNE